MSLKDDLDRLEEDRAAAETSSASATDELHGRQRELIERVMAGESTGDSILDYLLAVWNTSDARMRSTLENIEHSFKGKVGQLIMVISKRPNMHASFGMDDSTPGGLAGPSFHEDPSLVTLSLGVLGGERLSLDNRSGEITLPALRPYAVMAIADFKSEVVTCASDLRLEKWVAAALFSAAASSIEIVSGDEEVSARLDKTLFEDDKVRMVLPLGGKIKDLPDLQVHYLKMTAELEAKIDWTGKQLEAEMGKLIDTELHMTERQLLESARNIKAASLEMRRLMKRADNLGLNDLPEHLLATRRN